MSKINILSPAISNLIAAGEVVERPASVVKELIENCIDAGATSVSIEVRDGGSFIGVSDNGCGMDKEDVLSAFLPHATSKIRSGNDLFGIKTLGFRGEALASIAAVSRVNVLTKPIEAQIGCSADITIEGGSVVEKGSPDGTIITVSDLFYNVPARKKFLSKSSIEESAITDIVSRMIIANYSVSFKYKLNNKILFQSDGSGLNDAIYSVYSNDYLDKTQDIVYSMSDIVLYGRINKQGAFKSNRTYQNFFVNNRFVISPLISKAISEAYGTLMRRQYPFYTLFLNIPYSDVDVNVHPAKTEVRFLHSSKIYDFVMRSVNNTLISNMDAVKISTDIPDCSVQGAVVNRDVMLSKTDFQNTVLFNQRQGHLSLKEDEGIFSKLLNETRKIGESGGIKDPQIPIKQNDIYSENNVEDNIKMFSTQKSCINLEKTTQISMDLCPVQSDKNTDYKIVGTIFDTYIAIEYCSEFLLIDQHAAHERLLYDLYSSQIKALSVKTQQLLIPYSFNVNSTENMVVANMYEDLLLMGFELSEFGHNCYRITGVPDILLDINIAAFIRELLSETGQMKKSAAGLLRDKIAQAACKSAVKAGTQLSNNDITRILTQILESNSLTVCPHGRPYAVKISRRELEKWFRRVV